MTTDSISTMIYIQSGTLSLFFTFFYYHFLLNVQLWMDTNSVYLIYLLWWKALYFTHHLLFVDRWCCFTNHYHNHSKMFDYLSFSFCFSSRLKFLFLYGFALCLVLFLGMKSRCQYYSNKTLLYPLCKLDC